MRKLLIITAIFFISSHGLYALTASVTDSLRQLLPEAAGRTKTDLLINLGWELKYSDPDSAYLVSQEALSLAKSQNYTLGQALANRNIAGVYIIQGRVQEAIPYCETAYSQIEKTGNLYQKGKILNMLGIIQRDSKNFRQSMIFQNMALTIFRQLKDTFEITGNLNNLGLIYEKLGNREDALQLYHEVYDIEVRRNNTFGIARTANNLATLYQEMQKYYEAETMYEKSIRSARKIHNKQFESASLHGLGLLYQLTGHPDKAVEKFQQAIQINREAGFGDYLAKNYIQLASVYEDLGKNKDAFHTFGEALDEFRKVKDYGGVALALNGMSEQQRKLNNVPLALELAEKALKISDSLHDINTRAQIHHNFYLIYKYSAKPAAALENLEQYIILADSIKSAEERQLLEEIQTRYEVKNIRADNEKLLAQNQYQQQIIRNQRTTTIGIVIMLLLTSGLAVAIYIGRKKLNLVNKELTRKNTEILSQADLLHASNATKDKLFSIIAHDIRNPFAALLNLAEMLDEEVETADKETLRFYAGNIHQSASNTFQLLDNLLYWSKSQRGAIEIKPEPFDLEQLTTQIFNTAKAGAIENKLTLINQINKGTVITTDRTLLRIVLGNLVGNAVKFNKPGGKVCVTSSPDDGKVRLSIEDTGKGIPPERVERLFSKEESFQPSGSRTINGTGLGLILCKDFVEKLGGNITVSSTPGEGTKFDIILPLEFLS